jgi:hypothetical protein
VHGGFGLLFLHRLALCARLACFNLEPCLAWGPARVPIEASKSGADRLDVWLGFEQLRTYSQEFLESP